MSTTRRGDSRTSGDLVMAPRVPHGLAAAVEGLTREVIRHRPEDIYVFAAQHFEELLKLRDEFGAVTNLPGKSTNTAALREMNQSLKKRSLNDNKKWSMNDTARVLERHRSIFGDKGKKVTPEEVRALGEYEKENKSKRKDDMERFINSNEKRRGSNEKFVRRRLPMKDQEAKSRSDSNGNPKIISQIPTSTGALLVKDIKSELRKNRNSIRERAEKKTSERAERIDVSARVLGNGKKNNNNEKLIGFENLNDNQNRKKTESFSKMPRTMSMDRVREYVMEKFRSSESCEELRSTNYVDRVQEVIDEASSSILKKVKELSTRSAGRYRGYESVDESTSTSTRSDKSNQTEDVRSQSAVSVSRKSRRSSRQSKSKSKSKIISCADSLEGIETLASETEVVKTEKKKNASKSLSADSDLSDYQDLSRKVSAASSISLPAVRPPSSKNQSRSVSRSDSDNFVLPPISSEGNKSAKPREDLVLPSLMVSKDVIKSIEAHNDNDLRKDNSEVLLNLPDPPTDEIYKDSLNVTPDVALTPRPDSLEVEDRNGRNYETDSEIKREDTIEKVHEIEGAGNPDTVSVRDKLIEIQEAEKRLSDILEPGMDEVVKDCADIKIKEKLIVIEDTEKRIERIFDPDNQGDSTHVGIKEKLIEIEETEKRIEKILETETEEVTKDVGIKEKLIEIEDTEKRIQKIFNTDVEADKTDAGFMKEKLREIEEAEKRLENVFQINSGEGNKLIESTENHKSVPKTPFIPEIPSEFVVKVNASEEEVGSHENNEACIKPSETESQTEQILSTTPDSQGNSYILTEGSPYEIPDSVTTVIIPERILDTPSSEVLEIVVEDNPKGEDSKEISLRNILDNFGEIVVQQETTTGSSPDVDFIKNLKSSNDIVIDKKDLGLISEEEDKDIGETNSDTIVRDVLLHDIVESEENAEIRETESSDGASEELEKGEMVSGERKKRSLENLEPELTSPTTTIQQNATESTTMESTDEVKETTISDDGGNTAAESSVTLPSCGEEIGARNSESSNEVKETTISDQPADQIDDVTAEEGEEDSDIAQPGSENETQSDGAHESQAGEEVNEEVIVKEQVVVKEDPCTEESVYLTEPDTQNIKVENIQSDGDQEHRETLKAVVEVIPEKIIREHSEKSSEEEPEKKHEDRTETVHGETTTEVMEEFLGNKSETEYDEVMQTVPGHDREEMLEEDSANTELGKKLEIVEKAVDEDSEAAKTELKAKLGNRSQDVCEEIAQTVPKEDAEKSVEEAAETNPEGTVEKKSEKIVEAIVKTEAGVLGDKLEEVHGVPGHKVYEEHPVEKLQEVHKEVVEKVPEEAVENVPEDKSERLVEEVVKTEVERVLEDRMGELHEELGCKVQEKNAEEVAENVIEEKSEKLVEAAAETDSDVIVTEKLEKVHAEVVEKVSDEHYEENVEDIQEDIVQKVPEEVPESVPEEKSEKLVEEVVKLNSEGVLKEVHDDLVQKIPKEHPEDVAAKVVEEESDELVGEVVGTETEEELGNNSEVVHDELDNNVPEEINDSNGNKDETGTEPKKITEEILEGNSEKLAKALIAEMKPEDDQQHPELGQSELSNNLQEVTRNNLTEISAEEDSEDVAKNVLNERPEDEPLDEDSKTEESKSEDSRNKAENESAAESVDNESSAKVENLEYSGSKDPEGHKSEPASSDHEINEVVTSLKDFETLEALVDEESSTEIKTDVKKIETDDSTMRVPPEVADTGSMKQEERNDSLVTLNSNDGEIADEKNDIEASNVNLHPDPPKAEVVTNDLERTEYHIYVPEVAASQDYSTTESSTFNSAATKIQAGVRGFLTRRRLQSAQRRSSTLDSVPSIQDSFAADAPHLEPIEEVGLAQAATTIQSSYRGYKARQRLRREDAVQKTTMSVDNLFCGNGIQHTGEFHDCLPLPLLQDHNLKLKNSTGDNDNPKSDPRSQESNSTTEETQESLGLLGQTHYPFPLHQGLNVVVLSAGNDPALQSQYLNFITSIEEVQNEPESVDRNSNAKNMAHGFSTMKSHAGIESLPLDTSSQNSNVSLREPLAVPGTPTALIIEEISKTEDDSIPAHDNEGQDAQSLDLPGLSLEGKLEPEVPKPEDANESLVPDASLGTMSFSMNVDDMLGLGGESDPDRGVISSADNKMKPILEVTVTPRDLLKLTNRSEGSQVSADRVESPVTMMQIVPKSVDDKSDRSEDEGKDRIVAIEDEESKKSNEDGKSLMNKNN